MELEAGGFYRNGLGQVVKILGTVPPSSSWYAKGCRFVDSRGSFYLADGTMDTWLWKSLELTGEVKSEDAGEAENRQIQGWSPELLVRAKRRRATPGTDSNQSLQAQPDPEPSRPEDHQPSNMAASDRASTVR